MKNIIRRAILTELEDKKTKLLRMIYKDGLFLTAKMVGDYKKLIDLIGNNIPDDLKIETIKEQIEEHGSISEFEPILLRESSRIIEQIEYLGRDRVVVVKYEKGPGYPNVPAWEIDERTIDYKYLDTNIIDKICEIVLSGDFFS